MGHIILIYAVAISAVWLIAFLKDFYVLWRSNRDMQQQHKRIRGIFWLIKHEPWVHNFMNRFLYEIFFEACLCTMISVANRNYDTSY